MDEDLNGVPRPVDRGGYLHQLSISFEAASLAYSNSILGLFGDQGPLDRNISEEPIDNDETIGRLLAAQNL